MRLQYRLVEEEAKQYSSPMRRKSQAEKKNREPRLQGKKIDPRDYF